MTAAIRATPDFERIEALPRRTPDPSPFLHELSEALRRPGGTQQLRPVQAMALHDAGVCGGLFGAIGVGEGKTLLSLLVPRVLGAQRPFLLEPAALVEKTNRDRTELAKHWLIPKTIRIESYEMLGRVQCQGALETHRPDLIIADEVHKLKNKRAAVTRRVARYMHEHPDTRFVALSGTIMRKSLRDFAHILRWCLKDGAPVPQTEHELEDWAAALDEVAPGRNEFRRLAPGVLLRFCGPDETPANDFEEEERAAARRGFRRRLIETPGIVATVGEGERVDCSIYVRAVEYSVTQTTEEHFAKLRKTWETPDGWPLSQAVDVWRHAREMALGLFYKWDPRPPEDWRAARRAWAAYVREVLSASRSLDSELQVANACDAGRLPQGLPILNRWREIKPTFTPNTVPVWFDDSALRVCAEWMRKAPGIVWTEHALFAERLARFAGVKYFGAKGLASDGQFIDDADPKRSAIVSIDANREGRNLQKKWSRNLVTSPPEGADVWQQMIARTHRPGQTADEVIVDVLLGCAEHARAWDKARATAAAVRDTTGAEQKILLADVDWPSESELAAKKGARWGS